MAECVWQLISFGIVFDLSNCSIVLSFFAPVMDADHYLLSCLYFPTHLLFDLGHWSIIYDLYPP